MPHTSRNFIFAYAFLVILPIVGLAGILKGGHKLIAPPAIDGAWDFQVDAAPLDSLPCSKVLAAVSGKVVTISQSGRSFTFSSAGRSDVAGSGTLEGNKVRGSFVAPISSSESNCASGNQLTLLATVDRTADSKSLVGTLSVTGCPSCPNLAFRAEHQPEHQPPNPANRGH